MVDGLPISGTLADVNKYEVDQITVLKDAASAAIYGVQGGSGVILITTKRGSEAKPTITFKSSVNISRNTNFPEFLNALDYMRWHNLARELDGQTPMKSCSR